MITKQQHRVLFVAYQFPPVGGVGVHRVTKFVKYLPEFGWNSSILTVSNPSVPLHDESLLKDIPAGSLIRRAKTYEPGYGLKKSVSGGQSTGKKRPLLGTLKSAIRNIGNTLLQPDSQILWHPNAYKDGLKLLKDVHHDAIVATGPPFSSFLLGAKLAEKTGLPLILDYRDEWDISNAYWENKSQNKFSNWIQTRQQHKVLRNANTVLATTPSSAAAVMQIAKSAKSSARGTHIYNGFDPDDYSNETSIQKEDFGNGTSKFRLAFIGTLWNLNSIQPVVEALLKLDQSNPLLTNEIELLLAGRRTDDQEAIIDRLNDSSVTVTRLPFIAHDKAVQLMRSSDSLLMINSDLPKTKRIINAKTFEYMAARRPMFVVAPEGDVWNLVRELPGTVLCPPKNIAHIKEQLGLMVEQHRCGIQHSPDEWNIDQFHRRNLAEELADVLDCAITKESVSVKRFRSLMMGENLQTGPDGEPS